MNNFLGEERRFDLSSRVKNLRNTGSHSTKGIYNNSDFETLLLQEPVWGKEFLTARKAVRKIYQRQADLFNCPMP